MTRRGEITRNAIMDAAEALILEQGFAATSVDRIIARAGVSKGTFFYHFESKEALARALVDRLSRLDLELLEGHLTAAESAHDDPLDQVLAFVDAFIADADALTEPAPGCLFASYCSEAGLFDAETLGVIEHTYRRWRDRLGAKLEEVAEVHPPRAPVSLPSLADMMTVVLEGAYLLSKSLKEPGAVAGQLEQYRAYLLLLFGAGIRGDVHRG